MVSGYTSAQASHQEQKHENDFRLQVNMKLQSLERGMDSFKDDIMYLHGKLGEISKSMSIKHENHEQAIKDKLQNHIAFMEKEGVKLAYSASQALSASEYIANNSVDKKAYEKELDNINSKLKKMSDKLEVFKDEMRIMFMQKSAEFARNQEAFERQINSKPSEIPAVKKTIEDKIDLVALDGTNAIMRTQNCERQLFIIEKKIEQLFLQIKNLELRQG